MTTTTQSRNFVGWNKSSLKRNIYTAIQAYLKKEEQSQMYSITSQVSKLEKEEQMRPKLSRRRDIIKIREEIKLRKIKQ